MDLSRDLILEYKERGYRSLSRPLGWLLADAVFAIMNSEQLLTCTLVRIPSHPRPLRGFDALGAISREARSALHSAGIAVLEEPLLRIAAPYGALKGLGRTQRQQEVLGAFAAVGGSGSSNIVLVDDVITTGATTAEALAAFARSGSRVAAIAAVAATR